MYKIIIAMMVTTMAMMMARVGAAPATSVEDYDDTVLVGIDNFGDITIETNENNNNVGGRACSLPYSVGPCRALMQRWYYNNSLKKCVPFNYGGCDGNYNNFKSEKACLSTCQGR